jgi:hypothetical protein
MTRKSRRVLFYGLIALFLVLGTGVVLYSEGWRLDLGTGQASKIGAIYVRSYPGDAELFLDGKSVQNKSGFLSPGTLVSDLFPKTYALRLTKTGYAPWSENVTVLPSFVATLKYAVLTPQNAANITSGTVQYFLATPSALVQEGLDGTIFANGIPIGSGSIIAGTTDARKVFFKTLDGNYHLYDSDTRKTTDLTATLANDGIDPTAVTNIQFLDPHNGSQFLVAGPAKIWLLDLSQPSLSQIEKTPSTSTLSSSIAGENGKIAWTRFQKKSNTSTIFIYNTYAGALQGTSTTLPGATKKMAWIQDGLLGVAQDDDSLYLYNSGNDTAQKLASDVKDFSASADGTMVVALERASMEIFTLNDPTGYYRFNIPDVADVQKLIWYRDDNHLFVVYPDHVSFLDLADASLVNFTTVLMGTAPSYDASSNSLYFIDPQSQLMKLVFPS